MNPKEKKYVADLEHALLLFEEEVKAKDELIRGQEKIIATQEKHINKLVGLMDQLLNS